MGGGEIRTSAADVLNLAEYIMDANLALNYRRLPDAMKGWTRVEPTRCLNCADVLSVNI